MILLVIFFFCSFFIFITSQYPHRKPSEIHFNVVLPFGQWLLFFFCFCCCCSSSRFIRIASFSWYLFIRSSTQRIISIAFLMVLLSAVGFFSSSEFHFRFISIQSFGSHSISFRSWYDCPFSIVWIQIKTYQHISVNHQRMHSEFIFFFFILCVSSIPTENSIVLHYNQIQAYAF